MTAANPVRMSPCGGPVSEPDQDWRGSTKAPMCSCLFKPVARSSRFINLAWTQIVIISLICTLSRGTLNALNAVGGLGTGDVRTATMVNLLSSISFSCLSWMSGGVVNVIGYRLASFTGSLTTTFTLLSLMLFSMFQLLPQWTVWVAAILDGTGSGILWTACGTITINYPSENRKGMATTLLFAIYSVGAALGGLFAFAMNIDKATSYTASIIPDIPPSAEDNLPLAPILNSGLEPVSYSVMIGFAVSALVLSLTIAPDSSRVKKSKGPLESYLSVYGNEQQAVSLLADRESISCIDGRASEKPSEAEVFDEDPRGDPQADSSAPRASRLTNLTESTRIIQDAESRREIELAITGVRSNGLCFNSNRSSFCLFSQRPQNILSRDRSATSKAPLFGPAEEKGKSSFFRREGELLISSLLERRLQLLLLFSFTSLFHQTYLFNGINYKAFNVRTRGLNSFMYWTGRIPAGFIHGHIVDDIRYASRRRGIHACVLVLTLLILSQALTIVFWATTPAGLFDIAGNPLNTTPALLAFFFYGGLDTASQSFALWLISVLSRNQSSARTPHYVAVYRTFQGFGVALAWFLDLNSVTTYWTQFFVCSLCWLLALPGLFWMIASLPNDDDIMTCISRDLSKVERLVGGSWELAGSRAGSKE